MPPVKKDAAPAEGGIDATTRVASAMTATMGTAGKAVPRQHDAHIEHECT
ncbi:MAG TPA: hypothetical protein VGL01_23800 [Trinickia sp.]|jgi:hypothetical protein